MSTVTVQTANDKLPLFIIIMDVDISLPYVLLLNGWAYIIMENNSVAIHYITYIKEY